MRGFAPCSREQSLQGLIVQATTLYSAIHYTMRAFAVAVVSLLTLFVAKLPETGGWLLAWGLGVIVWGPTLIYALIGIEVLVLARRPDRRQHRPFIIDLIISGCALFFIIFVRYQAFLVPRWPFV
jgi:hypothetical protein